MSFLAVIPARFGSTRLPGKPLLEIAGQPMIQHVYARAASSQAKRVLVATDDQRIADVVRGFGGECVMTASDHPTGTDRLAEVADLLGLSADAIVVNVQGD
ncbi:MAG: NTP transferase domain-containing protein, partial [Litorivicinaceae bacterium]|nr:NTP transferase domain-containing protein [Litorivicinaceae bacterium]